MTRRGSPVSRPESSGGAPRRPVRRKSGNEGLWLALGAAAVVGVLVLLILSGSAPGEDDEKQAVDAFREIAGYVLDNRPDRSIPHLFPPTLLAETNLKQVKQWNELPPAERQNLEQQAFSEVRGRMILPQELGWTSLADVNQDLSGARVKMTPLNREVSIEWEARKGKGRWLATLLPFDKVYKLRRLERKD